MPQADSHHTPIPSRRDGGEGAVAAATQPSPDAELLTTFRRWVALESSLTAALARSTPEAEFKAACTAADDVARQIASMRATSADGVAAKAFLAAHSCYGGTYDDPLEISLPVCRQEDDEELDALMRRSLLADAAALLPAIKEGRA